MPINIRYSDMEKHGVRPVAYLCEDEWGLPAQLGVLEEWVSSATLPADDLVADVGFKVSKDAAGGGSVLSCSFLRSLADARVELWLSEYPPGDYMYFGDQEDQ